VLKKSAEGLGCEDTCYVRLRTVSTIQLLSLVGHVDLVCDHSPVKPVNQLLRAAVVALGAEEGVDLLTRVR
jgi:hypothetical protein